MADPVTTTYVLTFVSSLPDEADRRASLNRFLKAAKRAYGLRLVRLRTETAPKRAPKRAPKPKATSAQSYSELIDAVNEGLDFRR